MNVKELREALRHYPESWDVHDILGKDLRNVEAFSRDGVVVMNFRGGSDEGQE